MGRGGYANSSPAVEKEVRNVLTAKDKIEIALRAGMIAADILNLQGCKTKATARMVLLGVVARVRELDGVIDSLPED